MKEIEFDEKEALEEIEKNGDTIFHIHLNSLEIGWDKALHFAVCCVITLIPFLITWNVNWVFFGFLVAIMIGFMKELFDKYVKKTKFDLIDMIADILGAFLGVLIAALIHAL
jgi:VanZ family protein